LCLSHSGPDPFCERDGRSFARVRREQREFIATHTSPDVRHPEHLAHPLRYGAKRAIAHLVAVAIVDGLEAVEIDDQEGKGLA
jgi:hypothetical protein